MATVIIQSLMSEKDDLERLRLQVEKSRILVHQSEMKVEELEASMREIHHFKDRLVIFSGRTRDNCKR